MRKIWVVAQREFFERVRARWFIVSTILVPVLMVAGVAGSVFTALRGTGKHSIVILDASSSGFGAGMIQDVADSLLTVRTVRATPDHLSAAEDSLTAQVVPTGIDGFVVVTDSTLTDGVAEYRGSNAASLTDVQRLSARLQAGIVNARLAAAGIDVATARAAGRRSLQLSTLKIAAGKATAASGAGAFALAYAMWIVLYMAIILYGMQVLGSVIEEKVSRIVEVLVSSLRPFELMTGKVLGVGGAGLLQLAIWGVTAAVALGQQTRIARLLSSGRASATPFNIAIPSGTLVVFLCYFLLGYFLYSAMLAAVAATVNSESEARQAAQPVLMLFVIPSVLSLTLLISNPSGDAAFWLSMIPFTSPIAMPVRWASGQVPLLQVVGSQALGWLTALGVAWLAARVYRIGILMYGKKPSLPELLRWIRTA